MLQPRLIPVLLVRDKGLVKTVKFKDGKYVGDPINAVKIFNEMEADELTVLDIDATTKGKEPDFKMIENLANECRMPFCYGGGVKDTTQAQRILSLGVEKVAISSAAFNTPEFIKKLASQVGSQSVVVVLDIKKKLLGNRFECYTHNGTKNSKTCPIKFAQEMEKMGAGEIVINSINDDGMMTGYNLDMVRLIRSNINLPVTMLGGAGSYGDISKLIDQERIIGAAAGSLFVFKGKYKAVLINYPNAQEKNKIINKV